MASSSHHRSGAVGRGIPLAPESSSEDLARLLPLPYQRLLQEEKAAAFVAASLAQPHRDSGPWPGPSRSNNPFPPFPPDPPSSSPSSSLKHVFFHSSFCANA